MSQTFYKKGFLALAVATALGVSSYVQADVKIGVAGPRPVPTQRLASST